MPAPVPVWIVAVHLDARERLAARFRAPRIVVARATDAAVAITVRTSLNARVSLIGATLHLTCCADPAMAAPLFAVTHVAGDDVGDGIFAIAAADTSSLPLGKAYYTVEATWPDGKREQLVPVTELRIVATPDGAVPVGGSVRALRVGVVLFNGETELAAAFSVPLPTGTPYIAVLTPGESTEVGGGVPFAGSASLTEAGFTVALSGPFKGPVGYAIYPA